MYYKFSFSKKKTLEKLTKYHKYCIILTTNIVTPS